MLALILVSDDFFQQQSSKRRSSNRHSPRLDWTLDKCEEAFTQLGQSSDTHLAHSDALVDQVSISDNCWDQTDTPHPKRKGGKKIAFKPKYAHIHTFLQKRNCLSELLIKNKKNKNQPLKLLKVDTSD